MATQYNLFRNILLGGALCLGLLTAQGVLAAGGTITIEQQTQGAPLGSWVLIRPSGLDVLSPYSNITRKINDTPVGSYKLVVKPPAGAAVSISIYNGGALVRSIPHSVGTFILLESESLEVMIVYHYFGTIRIESDPSGATFELKGSPGLRYTGKTPAIFTSMPPLGYTLNFGSLEDCRAPKGQSRALGESGDIDFFGEFVCRSTMSVMATEDPVEPMMSQVQNVQIWQTSQLTEALPGTRVLLTIGVRNTGKSDLRNLLLTESFSPGQVQVIRPIPQLGAVAFDAILWTIPELKVGQSWTVTFAAELSKDLHAGDRVRLAANTTASIEDAAVTIGITTLPQTGRALDALIVMACALLSLFMTLLVRPRRHIRIHTA